MATGYKADIKAAIEILKTKGNLRTNAVRHAIARLEQQVPFAANDFRSFHDLTVATFIPVEQPSRPADFRSPSGSEYWDLGHGVIRKSDHWGQDIRSCAWFLQGASKLVTYCMSNKTTLADGVSEDWAVGYCAYADFTAATSRGSGKFRPAGLATHTLAA